MAFSADDPKWTAYVLDELAADERAQAERELAESDEARREVAEIRRTVMVIAAELKAEASPGLTAAQRAAIYVRPAAESPAAVPAAIAAGRRRSRVVFYVCGGLAAALAGVALLLPAVQSARESVRRSDSYQLADRSAMPSEKPIADGPTAHELAAVQSKMKQVGSAFNTHHDAWKEFPELLRSETLAWHDRRTGDRDDRIVLPGEIVDDSRSMRENLYGLDGAPGYTSGNRFDHFVENGFLATRENPLSTFSVDVDTAAYSILRRYLTAERRLPSKEAVRIEEYINYFHYDYPQPDGDAPFSANVEVAGCPWNAGHRLVRIGLKGKEIAVAERPPSNLVFLIDVSGSMAAPNRLPLVKRSMKLLLRQLGENDRVAIVVYAGRAGLVLPSTSALEQCAISAAIDELEASGSTNGGEGIQLAYETAQKNFIKGGTNRVILATDGDFNVGTTDHASLIELVTEKAKSGVCLTALGFGMGNLRDNMLVQLADKGNGNYGYIDDDLEARKLFVEQLSGTLVVIAKDVKLQIEFNPAQVDSYRLIGYEKRALKNEDFNDDRKDAGEIGAGHAVTALYEVVPAGAKEERPRVDPLKYQKPPAPAKAPEKGVEAPPRGADAASDELLTLKLRYKQPDGQTSKLIEVVAKDDGRPYAKASIDFKFASAVALFGMILRDSEFKGDGTLATVSDLAESGLGRDTAGYRAEFLKLVDLAKECR